MKRIFRKTAVLISAAAISLCSLPVASYEMLEIGITARAEESLMTRDVWCANEDVNRWESEHFQFIWGKNGADSSKITQQFLEENAKHLEACWDIYMNELSMEPPTQSVNMALRDGNKYKVNFYISGTGLSPFTDDWAYMGYDNQGYAFMFCCVGAMNNNPNPSWVLPHEFGHVVTAHQLGWNENKYVQAWWEAIANWYREQFLYSDYYQPWVTDPANGTDYFETYMKNLCFTPILGRDNYASWAFFQYLTENPDNLPGYGKDFMKKLMQQGERDEYPYLEIERVSGADLKDTLVHYAKRLATLDLEKKANYQARQNQLLQRGEWNWGEIFTVPDKSGKKDNYYTVPTERAPQQFGVNIIPLEAENGRISVTLEALTNVAGADWRACIVIESNESKTRYSELFKAGESMSAEFNSSTDKEAYIVVTATPDSDTFQLNGVPWAYSEGEFDENNCPFIGKTRYPYAVTINGADIRHSQPDSRMTQGGFHPNGGGFVAATAKVDTTAYVGKNAKVLGYATVSGNAVVDRYATVTGNAEVSGNAVVTGHAVVAERAKVTGNAIIADSAGVMGDAVVSENGRVIESGLVYDNYTVSGNATVKGVAFCMVKGAANGQAMPDGDYYDDSSRTISAGSVYGWTSPDKYVNSRPYTDGQCAGLEFDSDSSMIAADTYTSTYGIAVNSPKWSDTKTSGRGVLTFEDGQYLIADSSYAALHNADYQTAVLLRDNGKNEIFRFGTDDKKLTLTAEDGNITLNGGNQAVALDDCYKAGEWFTVSTIISGEKAKLTVNSGSGAKTISDDFSAEPVDFIADDALYLLADGMNGSMDYFRVNFKEVDEPEYYYTEKEDISAQRVLVGDVFADMSVDVYDFIVMRKIITDLSSADTEAKKNAADTNGDGKISIADAVILQEYLLGKTVAPKINS